MDKRIYNIDTYSISEEEFLKLYKQPAAQQVVEAVTQYNKLVSLAKNYDYVDDKALLIKEAEEDEAQAFLDGVFDIIESKV